MHRVVQKILVAVDVFSSASGAALTWALACAASGDVEVTVLYVWDPHTSRGRIFADSAQGRAFADLISTAESTYDALGGRVEPGDEPSRVIVDIVDREEFDLVVLGDAEGDSRVAQVVSAEAACKVVTISGHPRGGPAQATLTWNGHASSRPRVAYGSGAPPAAREFSAA